MASEHRSAHEYGDMSVSSSISHFGADQTTSSSLTAVGQDSEKLAVVNGRGDSTEVFSDQRSKSGGGGGNSGHSMLDKKALFDQAISKQHVEPSLVNDSGSFSVRSSQGNAVNGKSSFASSDQSGRDGHRKNQHHQQQQSFQHAHGSSHRAQEKQAGPEYGSMAVSKRNQPKLRGSGLSGNPSPGLSSDSDSDSDCSGSIKPKGFGTYKHVPHPPSIPPVVSYANEKDKFEMALNSKSTNKTPPFAVSGKDKFDMALINSSLNIAPSSIVSGKNEFDMALQNKAGFLEASGRDKFELALQSSTQPDLSSTTDKVNGARPQQHSKPATNSHGAGGVRADVVGLQLTEGNDLPVDEFDLTALGLDGELDQDLLDFDIDKYLDLDMEDLDEFLEKGWRPEESPQIPHSSYPVLGKITPSGDLGPLHNASHNNNNHNHHHHHLEQQQHQGVHGKPPAAPPQHPTHAWRNSPSAELRGRPIQSPSSAGVKPLPLQPSPAPSSVASAAETLGGGTVKSKKDELVDEWGFKDSRTAEMMMARAKKMKWNAERRKKLSKLDPQQRLHLFRKLEESGKIQTVRAPPARVLPRKEYFQAREDEAQRQHLERHVEERTRVHRTYEWLHTQVGDHPIASSRINPGHAPVHIVNEAGSGRQIAAKNNQENRKWSPSSDHLDSVSQAGGSRHRQDRRYSIGDSQYSSQTPSLPPIQGGSAPSNHKGERISFRDTPVEKSGGWGGGKRRGQYK
ncbi:hypothetical protein EGW08_006079 [Elysia chlorotica]|uniref:Uncharacterized protein n=1 Tax=Elysia chlorotica TaxID=188477 RepID=A0A3S1BKX4_ELYCH|nr:hypothetical protein EGW08_006079 [Elysia chlorotica]